jgi:hypothetical protein
VPGLLPGTTLLVHFEPASLPQPKDYTLALPLNLIYANQPASTQLEHWAFVQDAPYRIEWFRLVVPTAEEQYERQLRNLAYTGMVSSSLVVTYPSTGCVRVLDPGRAEVPNLPLLVESARARSNLGVIVAQPASAHVPPGHIFGAEPGHGWCYFFQKADLARQQGDWEQVAQLAAELGPLGLAPRDPTEWLPFAEGYLALQRFDEARALVDRVFPTAPSNDAQTLNRLATRRAFCDLVQRLAQQAQPPSFADVHLELTQRLACDSP